jgi:hypothetical protein
MGRPRVQFTMRRMMIAVALCAVAFAVIVQPGPPRSVKATSSDPRVAIRQEKVLRGVLWGMSYDQARERAKREGRPILIFFTGVNDSNSRMMEDGVFLRTDVVPHLSRFETVTLFMDYAPIHSLTPDQREKIGEENGEFQAGLTGEPTTPQLAVVYPFGKLIAAQSGYLKPGEFIAFLEAAESVYRLRSGAARYPSWPVWAFGSLLVAAACLVAVRARIRRENESRTKTT